MKPYKILSALTACSIALTMSVSASAADELTMTGNACKFQIGSSEMGGSGVEPEGAVDGKNWIKVIQSSNAGLKLFEDIGPDVNVTALAVTFEISDWSGTEFSVSWGGNIDFINDASTTWCGTDTFGDISSYTINGNGEYTLICDLGALSAAQKKEGIAHLQTCEMVIGNVADGDSTTIDIKSARIYVDGETPENVVIPTQKSEESEPDKSTDPTSSEAVSSESSAADTDSSEHSPESSSQEMSSVQNTIDSSNVNTGAGNSMAFVFAAASAALAVVLKRRK